MHATCELFSAGPYAFFVRERYQDTAKALPASYQHKEIIRELCTAWHAMPEEERAEYKQKFTAMQKAKWASKRVRGNVGAIGCDLHSVETCQSTGARLQSKELRLTTLSGCLSFFEEKFISMSLHVQALVFAVIHDAQSCWLLTTCWYVEVVVRLCFTNFLSCMAFLLCPPRRLSWYNRQQISDLELIRKVDCTLK